MESGKCRVTMRVLLLLAVAMLVLSTVSCESKKPKGIIAASKMEDVLYDYHLLESMRRTLNLDSVKSVEALLTIYDKYGITQADFDSSMVYYLRHTDQLQGIYKRLSERIEKEAIAQGAEGGNIDFSSGDTANVWRGATAYVFNQHPPFNVVQYRLPVDTAYKAGDRLILSFNTNFLYESGGRSGVAVLSVTLNNDSVVTRTMSLSGSMRQTLEVVDSKRLGIKDIQGMFIQKESTNEADRNSTAARTMIISDIKLVRMHVDAPKPSDNANNNDSVKAEKGDTLEVKVEKTSTEVTAAEIATTPEGKLDRPLNAPPPPGVKPIKQNAAPTQQKVQRKIVGAQ